MALDPTVRQRVPSASPATIDRLLASVRVAASGRRKQKTATKQSKQVPIRTFADWNDPPPGFLEIDFVSHGGNSVQGAFLWSLTATDVCSGWTEAVPLPGAGQTHLEPASSGGNGLQKRAWFSAGDVAMSLYPGLPRFLPAPPSVK